VNEEIVGEQRAPAHLSHLVDACDQHAFSVLRFNVRCSNTFVCAIRPFIVFDAWDKQAWNDFSFQRPILLASL
jgi:hypothetical protein